MIHTEYQYFRSIDDNDETFIWKTWIKVLFSCAWVNKRNEKIISATSMYENLSMSKKRTLILINLFWFIQISFFDIFQNEKLKHNNFINFALWENRYIWFEIEKFDVMISLDTRIEFRTFLISIFNFRYVIHDDFILRLWRFFMFFFDEQNAWRDFWNRLNDRSKQDFFKLNFNMIENESIMNEIERMNEFRVIVHITFANKKQFHQITFAFLVSFFFELIDFFFHNDKFYCNETIRCRLNEFKVCIVMKKLNSFKCVFLNDNELFEYFELNDDCCEKCRRYQKRVEFIVWNLTKSISMFIQNIQYDKKIVDDFSKTINWFIQQQKIEILSHDFVTIVACNHCEFEKVQLHFSMSKRKMTNRSNQIFSQHKWSRRKIDSHVFVVVITL